MTYADALKRFRNRFGITQKQAALSAGILEQAYQKYEYGRDPSVSVLCKLADAYDVSADYLLGRVQTPDSMVIEEIAYDGGSLFVHFRSNDWYQYLNVPKEVYDNFSAASSKGKFFLKNIMPNYSCVVCEEPPRR